MCVTWYVYKIHKQVTETTDSEKTVSFISVLYSLDLLFFAQNNKNTQLGQAFCIKCDMKTHQSTAETDHSESKHVLFHKKQHV